jgi:molybdopterin converting factor small subunit
MSVRVSFMGVIANVTGQKELTLASEPGVTLRQVLESLEEQYGEEFGRRLFRTSNPPRRLQMHTRIFVNRQLVEDGALDDPLPFAGDAAVPASSEVLIYLMPAACGG